MPDPLHITPHPEQERSYAEMRDEYRAQNLQRIRGLLKDYRLNGVKMKLMGRPLDLQGEARSKALLAALDEPVTQDFGLGDVPMELSVKLEDLAQESVAHDSVTWDDSVEGVVDHDAPEILIPVEKMTDEELLLYVDTAIENSRRKDG
jgi:hypothetical protein